MDHRASQKRWSLGPRLDRGHLIAGARRFAGGLTVWLALVGPWPVDDSGPDATDYQNATLVRLDRWSGVPDVGPIRVGMAEVDLSPSVARPLAGFIGQVRTPFVGVDTPCLARGITIRSASATLTVLTADLLLINARLAREVENRTGSRPGQIYFTASHTHGGPGGWGAHPLEMLVAGAYDPAAFDELAERLAEVVRRSRANSTPAEVGFVEVQAANRQKNRIDPALPTHDALSALVFRATGGGPPLAILAVFGAHATVSHPVPPRLGGDYPAALALALKKRTGARMVAFAAGAVGDASPARPQAPTQQASAEALGTALANDLAIALPAARFVREIDLRGFRLDVDLPASRVPFLRPWLRFSPFASWWISDRKTHLDGLRIGPVILVGFPGDYSGHLADRLTRPADKSNPRVVVTSFNGDFKGYLVSEAIFRRRPCYETRWMSFFGPWTGDYLTDLAGRMVGKLGGPRSVAEGSGPPPRFLAERSALVLLGLTGFVLGWRHPGGIRPWLGQMGIISKLFLVGGLGSIVGLIIEPEMMAWARVGLPEGSSMIGLAVGVGGLVWSRFRRSRRTSMAMIGLALFLVSANWLLVLAMLRFWVVDDRVGMAAHQS